MGPLGQITVIPSGAKKKEKGKVAPKVEPGPPLVEGEAPKSKKKKKKKKDAEDPTAGGAPPLVKVTAAAAVAAAAAAS